MNEAETRDLIPLWIRGGLSPSDAAAVSDAVDSSEELAVEAAFLRELLSVRPVAPSDLADRIIHSMHDEPVVAGQVFSPPATRRGLSPWWLSAAATVAIALGGSWMLKGSGDSVPVIIESGEAAVAFGVVPSVWPSDDGIVAGEAILGGLSDEQLERLLEEMRG